ncbi:MAG: hypothetical protein JWN34_5759 [Bryobacterales bacterium]|jgi:hypothetical protein|nr:hypothetical protein [Bryobacterales bacterium]
MIGSVFLKQGEKLIPLAQQSYASEIVLQQLLEYHPDLLAGEQMTDGAPRRWLLVSRELPIGTEQGGSNWYLDHLYLDQDAIPTLVEVKCSTDPRIRREVIGQMFDYAANAVARVTTADLQAKFDNTPDSTRRLDDFLQEHRRPDNSGNRSA